MPTKRMGVLCCLICAIALAGLAACNTQSTNSPDDMSMAESTSRESVGDAAVSERNTIPDKTPPVVLPDGMVMLRGAVVGGGAPCVQFRTDDGQQISLEGASPRDFAIGDRFEITGQFVAMSRCMQGPGFAITSQTALTE